MSSEAALPFPQVLAESDIAPDAHVAATEPLAPDKGKHEAGVILSDEELLQTVGKGNKQALGALFERHGRSVLHVAWRILRDEGEADDLRQEVFLYIYQRAGSYDATKASAASWIIQITYHRAIDRRRHLNSRHHYRSEELDEQGIGADRRY